MALRKLRIRLEILLAKYAARRLVLAVAVLLLVITGLFYYNGNAWFRKGEMTFGVSEQSGKPSLSGSLVRNPDIAYSSFGWLAATPENLKLDKNVLNSSSDWQGDGYAGFNNKTLGGRTGVAILHPVDRLRGRFIAQPVQLPKGAYRLYAGVANAGGMSSLYRYSGECADVGIRMTIEDVSQNKTYIVFNKILKNDGWHDYAIDVGSTVSGKTVLRAESYAADGGCGDWNGEWAAIDYIAIVPN